MTSIDFNGTTNSSSTRIKAILTVSNDEFVAHGTTNMLLFVICGLSIVYVVITLELI